MQNFSSPLSRPGIPKIKKAPLLRSESKKNQFPKTVPASLKQLISSKVSLLDVQKKVDSVDIPLLNALNALGPNENQVRVKLDGHTYVLENGWDENDNRALQVKNKAGTILATLKNNSLEQLQSRLTLLSLLKRLNPDAQSTFRLLFDPIKIGHVDAKSPVCPGDQDGSIARQIVLGIQVGIVGADSERLATLALLMNAEAEVLDKINTSKDTQHFRQFQENPYHQNLLEELANHLTFKQGHGEVICTGDILFDRLSCNIRAAFTICYKMHQQGAIFINGNHDNFIRDWGNPDDADFDMHCAVSFGGFAKNDVLAEDCLKYQQLLFVNAYYHKETNTLYLHRGLLEEIPEKIETGFGWDSYPMPTDDAHFDMEKFVEWINVQPRPIPESLIKDDTELENNYRLESRSTDFRPDEIAMRQLAKKLGVRIVHGHDGWMDTSSEDVIALNARTPGKYAVVAARIGRSDLLESETLRNEVIIRDITNQLRRLHIEERIEKKAAINVVSTTLKRDQSKIFVSVEGRMNLKKRRVEIIPARNLEIGEK